MLQNKAIYVVSDHSRENPNVDIILIYNFSYFPEILKQDYLVEPKAYL